MRHADTIAVGSQRLVFSWPAEGADRRGTRADLGRDFFEHPLGDVEVRVHLLHIVELFERVNEP